MCIKEMVEKTCLSLHQPYHLDISKAFEVSLDSADWSMESGPVGKLGMKIVLEKRSGKSSFLW